MNGHTDKEIASESELSADVFGGMKYGNYWGWNDEDNKLRGDEICRGLVAPIFIFLYCGASILILSTTPINTAPSRHPIA